MQTFNWLPFVTTQQQQKTKTRGISFIHFVSLLYSLPKNRLYKLSNHLYPRKVKYKRETMSKTMVAFLRLYI